MSADVSVIIPTFHREKLVVAAVESALLQRSDGVSVEVIVLDDSPSGSASKAVEAIGDADVRYVRRTVPSGGRPALVRNEGARLARGGFLHFLDDDDVLEGGSLATLADALHECLAAWPAELVRPRVDHPRRAIEFVATAEGIDIRPLRPADQR